MQTKKLAQLNQYIESADLALQQAREVLADLGGDKIATKLAKGKAKSLITVNNNESQDLGTGQSKIIEGIFNGQNMIGPDGKEYSVPANYASKSKLVEGDVLKLTIQDDGSFLYKQINPVARTRVKGKLVMDEMTGQYAVLGDDNKKYNVLTASVTYFKGQNNDQVTILIPKNKTCQWASIENVISTADKGQDIKPEPFEKLAQEIKKPASQNNQDYQGISQHAKSDPILPEISDLDEAPVMSKNDQKSQQEREKIESMINEDLEEI